MIMSNITRLFDSVNVIQKRTFIKNFKKLFQRIDLPPIPKQIPQSSFYFNIERVDEFQWMQDPNNQDVREYIAAENEFTNRMMVNTKLLQRRLFFEMKNKLITPEVVSPLKVLSNGYEYYTKHSNYGTIYYRRKKKSLSNEEILLDSKKLTKANKQIKSVLLSTDENLLGYLVEQEGDEIGSLHFKDLSRYNNYQNEILEGVFNFLWGTNAHIIYYTVTDEQLRPYKVYAHQLGTSQRNDMLIYEEKDYTSFVDITSTKDQSFIMINSNTFSSSEVRFFDAHHDVSQGTPELKLIEPRTSGLEYYVDHRDGYFYILTNADNCHNFKLVRTRIENIRKKYWETIFTVKETERIEDVDIFKDYVVIFAKSEGLPVLMCHELKSSKVHQITLPTNLCAVSPEINIDCNTNIVRFTCNLPLAHETTYEYNMKSRNLYSIRSKSINDFDSNLYTCYRTRAKASDNTEIPITLLHKKSLIMNHNNPVLLRSYGAYGITTDPDFQLEHFPLLERGWVIALAHVRGGSELGYSWYDQGRLMNKKNSFTDFISVVEYLISAGYSNASKISAIGAAFNMRPDPLTSMLNPNLPLTKIEYNEWGNPLENKDIYKYISSYAPYDNISYDTTFDDTFKQYNIGTSILVTAGMQDQRVNYWHSLKWVSKMRIRQAKQFWPYKKNNLLILKIDTNKGHFGSNVNNQSDRIRDLAFEFAFLITQVQ
ncbi:oligopeptidase b [Gigaspora margarita]|uniref:Prolyl endopeptidase n=2 Tax=Gigaspora margarita TaxID=4874 RepID=A0A8H3X1T5_GIGMA|nr:oligopeptidase b [Gigaspora margarita]